MKDKIILDLCGGTGSWSRPYQEAGYDVRVITLPAIDIFKWDEYTFLYKEVYGILAAPDCSHFSFARQNANTPRDLKRGFQLVKRCRDIIEFVKLHGNLKFWAIENPVGYLRQILGKPCYTFEAWWFGDPWKKRTDLWGYFNIPKENRCDISIVDSNMINQNHWHKIQIPEDYQVPPGWCKKKIKRAITPPGFAAAFFAANQ